MSKNFLRPGDKVLMKNGNILTIKGLEFKEFTAQELSGYISKKEIQKIIEDSTDGCEHDLDWNIEKHIPPNTLEDWHAYDVLKERIRAIYPPGEDERKIKQLLNIVRM